MPIPAPVTNVLVRLLNVAAYQLGDRLGEAFQDKSSEQPVLLEQVKSDLQYIQAQTEYLNRKQDRDKELLTLCPLQVERRIELQEQELQDREYLSQLQRQLMGKLQTKATQLKLDEISGIWHKDAWFYNLSLPNTEQILARHQHRLLLLVAPPRISKDCPDSFHNNLEIELRKVGEFLNRHYSLFSDLCSVEFYSDYFKCPISDLDVKRLQPILAPVPTAIIYSDISDYEVTVRVGFWGSQQKEVFLFPTQTWNWEKDLEALETAGYSQKQSLRLIREVIVIVHKLLSAFLADAYYLYIDPNYEPQLFDLDSELDREWLRAYINVLKDIQQRQRQVYQQELRKIAAFESERQAEEKLRKQAEKWRCVHTLAGHSNWVCCVAISPDGQLLASGSSDNAIKLWNLKTGEEIITLAGHSDRVNYVTFSPDGQSLVSDSSDNTIKLWNLKTGEEICTISGKSGRVFPILINSDQTNQAGGLENNIIKLWNLKTGQETCPTNGNSTKGLPVAISPDGEIIAGGGEDNTIKLWSLKTGQEICTLMGHCHWVNAIAFSPDGKILASGSVDDTIKLWNLTTCKENITLTGHSHWVNSVAFSPDGKILASGSMDRTIKLWNLKTCQEIRSLLGHAGGVLAIAIAPDGQTMVSGSTDGIVKIWRYE